MGRDLADESGDLIEVARRWLAAVIFFKSSGRGSRLALSLARGARDFREFEADPKTHAYFAGFSEAPEDVGRLLALMTHASRWTGTMLFVRGRPVQWDHRIARTLQCYMRSFEHDDPNLFCRRSADLSRPAAMIGIAITPPGQLPPPAPPTPTTAVVPCRELATGGLRDVMIDAELRAEVLASAIEQDISWCPRFNVDRLEIERGDGPE